jgi:hypothetical protein
MTNNQSITHLHTLLTYTLLTYLANLIIAESQYLP